MKTIHIIGSSGMHDVLLHGNDGRIIDLRIDSGVDLIHSLITGKLRDDGAAEDPDIEVWSTRPLHQSRTVFHAERAEGGHSVSLSGIIGERVPLHHDPPGHPVPIGDHDLLVIHDIGSVRPDRDAWKTLMDDPANARWSVVTTDDPIWLVDAKGAERRILVVDADTLRSRGAAISTGRSWDDSFTGLIQHLNGSGGALMKCAAHLLVRFGTAGLVHVRPDKKGLEFTAHFLPAEVEEEGSPEKMAGLREVFIARLSMELTRSTVPHQEVKDGPVTRVPDIRTVEQRIPFAAIEALRSARMAQDSGWIVHEDELAIPAEVFALPSNNNLSIAGMDITALPDHGSLLDLATHGSHDTLMAWAVHHVLTGENGVLGATPMVPFGGLLSADRQEIEQYRAIRDKMFHYVAHPGDKPMSIGVFGPPGSGKTFGVEQIKDMLGEAVTWISIDFGGFQKEEQILKEWQGIRNENIRLRIPFVLFDEFDAPLHGTPYGWFQHFLQPVNNGVFREDTVEHPVGRGIFVFTGGTCHTYAELRRKSQGGDPVNETARDQARERKMPDMLRRLEDHIDVKGVSRRPGEPADLYLVRRAVVLRKQFIGKRTEDVKKKVDVDLGLLVALLRIEDYHNGTSAMCKLVARIKPNDEGRFGSGALPADDELDNYVDPKALKAIMTDSAHLQDVIESLARMIHEGWRKNQDPKEKKEADVPWDELSPSYQDSNRMQAMDMVRKLASIRCRIVKDNARTSPITVFTANEVESMARDEHDRWMKEKLAAGWVYGPERNNLLRIHPLLIPYDELDEKAKEMDREPVRRIPEWLREVGFGVVRGK